MSGRLSTVPKYCRNCGSRLVLRTTASFNEHTGDREQAWACPKRNDPTYVDEINRCNIWDQYSR